MIISTRGRYALRVMIDLARRQTEGYLPLKEIAHRQDISEKYLETIIKIFVRSRLLEGLRGKGGGYRLTRKPEEYTLGEILRLAEGSLSPVACVGLGSEGCSRPECCAAQPIWQKLDELINNYLDSVTLADLIAQSHYEQPIEHEQ